MNKTLPWLPATAVLVAALAFFPATSQAQPVVFDVSTNHGGDTIYLGNPAEIVFRVDAGAHPVQGMNFVFAFSFTNGLSVGDLVEGDNFNFTPFAQNVFATQYLSPNWAAEESPDTVFFSAVSNGLPWTTNDLFVRIRFEPTDTGTIYLDSLTVPPANYTGALGPGGEELPLDWRPGPIVVVPCPGTVGDLNGDGVVTLGDIIMLINFIFKSGPAPQPHVNIGDADCSGVVTAADVIYLLNYQGKSGPAPCPCYMP